MTTKPVGRTTKPKVQPETLNEAIVRCIAKCDSCPFNTGPDCEQDGCQFRKIKRVEEDKKNRE